MNFAKKLFRQSQYFLFVKHLGISKTLFNTPYLLLSKVWKQPHILRSMTNLACSVFIAASYNVHTYIYLNRVHWMLQEMELDNNCVNTLAAHYGLSAEHIWQKLGEKRFDNMAATYHLLLMRKKQGLSLELAQCRQVNNSLFSFIIICNQRVIDN